MPKKTKEVLPSETAKPLLKWVGGKSKLLEEIFVYFPKVLENYYEPFVGGGSVLFEFLRRVKCKEIELNGKVYASDSNKYLINFYKCVQENPTEIYEAVEELKLPSDASFVKMELYYYEIRDKFKESCKKLNLDSSELNHRIQNSAYFIYLNKTCFRGVYRESKNGFNVPYGNYKNPEILNKEHLLKISELIKDVEFRACDFGRFASKASAASDYSLNILDFVFLDPPYVPENATSFVKYTNDGFTYEKHMELFNMLPKLNCMFVLTNSHTDLVLENTDEFSVKVISARRAINSKKPESVTNEVIVYN